MIDGLEALDELEKTPVNPKNFRPLTESRINKITIHANPLAGWLHFFVKFVFSLKLFPLSDVNEKMIFPGVSVYTIHLSQVKASSRKYDALHKVANYIKH